MWTTARVSGEKQLFIRFENMNTIPQWKVEHSWPPLLDTVEIYDLSWRSEGTFQHNSPKLHTQDSAAAAAALWYALNLSTCVSWPHIVADYHLYLEKPSFPLLSSRPRRALVLGVFGERWMGLGLERQREKGG